MKDPENQIVVEVGSDSERAPESDARMDESVDATETAPNEARVESAEVKTEGTPAERASEAPKEKEEEEKEKDITEEAVFLALENDQLRRDIAKAKADVEAAVKESSEARLRALADLENTRRRVEREVETVRKFGVESLLMEIVPVWDNLERAIKHAANKEDPLARGVDLVLKQFQEALAKYGAVPFHAEGERFDPTRHEAISRVPSEKPEGTVVAEVSTGFMLHDRLMRPAMVVVAGPMEASATETAAAAAPAETVETPGESEAASSSGDDPK